MAVTLTLFDVVQPLGELDPTMLPGYDLDALATAWLAQAVTLVEANANIAATDQDAAAAAWVYYRAYSLRSVDAMGQASSMTVDSVSKSVSQDQRTYWRNLAAYWKGIYDGFAATGTAVVSATSVSLNNVAVW